MLDPDERDRARALNVIGDKSVSAFSWLECDAQASFCHEGLKFAFNWTPYLPDGWVGGPFPLKEVPHSTLQTALYNPTNCAEHTNNRLDGGVFSATTPGFSCKGDRLETAWLNLSTPPVATLGQGQEPERASGEAGARGGLDKITKTYAQA